MFPCLHTCSHMGLNLVAAGLSPDFCYASHVDVRSLLEGDTYFGTSLKRFDTY